MGIIELENGLKQRIILDYGSGTMFGMFRIMKKKILLFVSISAIAFSAFMTISGMMSKPVRSAGEYEVSLAVSSVYR